MSRPATDRLKVNRPLGMMPALQYLPPDLLQVDQSYQRTLDTDASRTLVRGIAQHWNWDLCQPLVVARRDGTLYVINGQHRLAAARLRGDIAQLPAVVVQYASAADEAASFVHLNQQRRPLTKIDLFKAAVASGDSEAAAILAAVHAAGLTIAPHSNPTAWKPGMVSNIGGLEVCWRQRGARVTQVALRAMADGLQGQVLQYAGTLFPGIAAVVDKESDSGNVAWAPATYARLCAMIRADSQVTWRSRIHHARGAAPNLNFARASEQVFLAAWNALSPEPEPEAGPDAVKEAFKALKAALPDGGAVDVRRVDVPSKPKPEPDRGKAPNINWGKVTSAAGGGTAKRFKPDDEGKAWCEQCERRRDWTQIGMCTSKFCSFGAKS